MLECELVLVLSRSRPVAPWGKPNELPRNIGGMHIERTLQLAATPDSKMYPSIKDAEI